MTTPALILFLQAVEYRCRDNLRGLPVKAFNTRTGEIVHEFRVVQKSCLSVDVSRDGQMAVLGDTTGIVHMENMNYIRKEQQQYMWVITTNQIKRLY